MLHLSAYTLLVPCLLHAIFALRLHLQPSEHLLNDGYKPRWSDARRVQRRLHAEPAGNTVKFICRVEGKPQPSVTWLKDGQVINRDDRISGYRIRKEGQMLMLESVIPADDGLYTCIASNKYGSINHTYELDVQDRGSASRPELMHGLPSNQTASVGSDVTFRCRVVSDPYPHIKWIRHVQINGSWMNGNNVPNLVVLKSSSFNTTQREMEILLLKNVSFQDAGEYTCLAGNLFGISHQSAWLTVVKGQSNEGYKPRWIKPKRMQKSLYAEPTGSSVRFSCRVRGEPLPSIIWQKNGQEIVRDGRTSGYKIKNNGQALVLHSVVQVDDGLYTCTASNKYGSINRTYELDVQTLPANEHDSLQPIIDQDYLRNTTVLAGSDVSFICKVLGDSNPYVAWIRTRTIGSQTRTVFLQESAGLKTSDEMELLLENVSHRDAGEYTCIARDSIGIAQRSVWLKVIEENNQMQETSERAAG